MLSGVLSKAPEDMRMPATIGAAVGKSNLRSISGVVGLEMTEIPKDAPLSLLGPEFAASLFSQTIFNSWC